MELKLTNLERSLLRESLMNTYVNADNFGEIEKEVLMEVYDRIKQYEESENGDD